MISSGGPLGSTTGVDGTPASSAMRWARLSNWSTRLGLIAADVESPAPDTAVTASSVRWPSGPASEAAIPTPAMLPRVPSTAHRMFEKRLVEAVAESWCVGAPSCSWECV